MQLSCSAGAGLELTTRLATGKLQQLIDAGTVKVSELKC